jgi:hypothetical protein
VVSGEDFNRPSEHEREIARQEHDRGRDDESPMGGSDNRVTGEGVSSTYEREVEAEQRGEHADQLDEGRDEADAPVDSAYRPRTG